ncbi:ABC transporter ATP-binding protein/permease [Streptomyces sp. NBC_01390]|uniref:ATP-binding cassette domain-containing protein n=1 Tax=Streptomyces sp. NBC_01390 TaxID=2903850 RepID=UPI00324DC218
MKRVVSLWAELFALSWRRTPGVVAGNLAVLSLGVVATCGTAVALARAVDGMAGGNRNAAVVGAAAAAVCYAVSHMSALMSGTLRVVAVERVGLTDVNSEIYRDIGTLQGLEHLERTDFLDRVTTVSRSAWGIANSLWGAIGMLADTLQLVVLLCLLGTVSPWLLLLLPAACLPLLANYRAQRLVTAAETETAEDFRLQRHLFELATDAGSGKEIRVAGATAALAERQSAAWDRAMRARYRARLRASAVKAAGWAVFTMGFGGGLGLVAWQAAHGQGSSGDVVLTITVAATLRQAVQQTLARAGETLDGMRLVEPFLWLRAYAARDRARARGTETVPGSLREGIRVEQVTYTYPGTDRIALDAVSCTLPAGAVVAVVGEYGSGKTTLVKLLAKFYRPDSGRITVDGCNLASLDTDAWRARISAAFQDFGRFRTVFAETVGLGDLPHKDEPSRIAEAVAAADAESVVDSLPEGLDTRLGRELGGVDLSEGQWQKTALARAAMRQSPLLLVLDEPTASLDAPSEREIFQRYMDRARSLAARTGAVTVIVSHRFSTLSGADLILVMDRGRLAEQGTHEELLALGGRYANLYGIQATAYTAS